MNNKEMTILLLTVYMGSGKTTLVNSILKKKKGIYVEILVFFIRERNNGRMQNV